MSSPKNIIKTKEMSPERRTVKDALESLNRLTSPLRESKFKSSDEALVWKLQSARMSSDLSHFNAAHAFNEIWNATDAFKENQIRWTFARTCLRLIEVMKDTMSQTDDEKIRLLGVHDKNVLGTAFDFIMHLSVFPYLLPTVDVVRKAHSKKHQEIEAEMIEDAVKYKRLYSTMDSLLDLCFMEEFHEIISSKHLNGILCALIQLAFNPFKKPTQARKCLNSREANYEFPSMTYSAWLKVEYRRKGYQTKLEELQNLLYLPHIVDNYMLLLGCKAIPRWMYLGLRTSITNLFLKENGLIFAIKILVRVDFESPLFGTQCRVLSKLLSTIFCMIPETKLKEMAPQFKEILCKDNLEKHDYVSINALASTIENMMKTDQKRTETHIIDVILSPLRNIVSSSEEDIVDAIIQVCNLCVTPSNKLVEFPEIIESVYLIEFFLYAQIKNTVCYLKTPLKKLLIRFLEEADKDQFTRSIDVLLFDKNVAPKMIPIPAGKKVVLSSNGGIMIEDGEMMFPELENGVTLCELIKESENSKSLFSYYFKYLQKTYVDSADKDSDKERMIVTFLLTQFAQDSQFLQCILENPETIVAFIWGVLKIHNEKNEQNTEIIRICLLFLTMVLRDIEDKKVYCWGSIVLLRPYLEKLRRDDRDDIKALARELYHMMNVYSNTFNLESSPAPSAYQEAIEDSCHSLLPVRAHALMVFIDLLKKGDKEVLAKKEEVLLIFKENLKDEDSFLYLRAIEGMACLALLMPNTIIPLLCDEFLKSSSEETRLKIGEVLMRTIRSISDVVVPIKDLLINTFINGARDGDSVIRASSLSNLSELCLTLKWNMWHVLYEILECANCALIDSFVEARRAAVLLIGSLTYELYWLQSNPKLFRELRARLKVIISSDEDEVMRLQAQVAKDNLNRKIKATVFPTISLEKKICVLKPF